MPDMQNGQLMFKKDQKEWSIHQSPSESGDNLAIFALLANQLADPLIFICFD
jgi:hypothetical protein